MSVSTPASLIALHLTPSLSPRSKQKNTSQPKSNPPAEKKKNGEKKKKKRSSQEEEEAGSAIFGRRRAMGVGISCLSLLDALFFPSEETAAAVAAEESYSTPSSSTCVLTAAPSGLAFCDSVVGTGPEAARGQLIKAHYVGKLEDGKVFDSSYARGKPLTFRVGVGERIESHMVLEIVKKPPLIKDVIKVIKGWDQGILGGDGIPPMLSGGKRLLKLPPDLGYGIRGAGCKGGSCIIPPDSTLLFDVEFIGKG